MNNQVIQKKQNYVTCSGLRQIDLIPCTQQNKTALWLHSFQNSNDALSQSHCLV